MNLISQTGKQAQNSAKLRILFVASETFIKPIPPHPGVLSEFCDILRLHDEFDRIQNAAQIAFLKRLSEIAVRLNRTPAGVRKRAMDLGVKLAGSKREVGLKAKGK